MPQKCNCLLIFFWVFKMQAPGLALQRPLGIQRRVSGPKSFSGLLQFILQIDPTIELLEHFMGRLLIRKIYLGQEVSKTMTNF